MRRWKVQIYFVLILRGVIALVGRFRQLERGGSLFLWRRQHYKVAQYLHIFISCFTSTCIYSMSSVCFTPSRLDTKLNVAAGSGPARCPGVRLTFGNGTSSCSGLGRVSMSTRPDPPTGSCRRAVTAVPCQHPVSYYEP